MTRTRRIAILVYDGVQSLDVTGPLEVFARRDCYLRERDPAAQPAYRIEIIAARAGHRDHRLGAAAARRRARTATCAASTR